MKQRLLYLAVASLFVLAGSAAADVLWDQSSYDPWGAGFYNSESGAPPFGITMHAVGDVNASDAWNITTITQYYSALDPVWGEGIVEGYVHVWPRTAAFPVEDPTLDPVLPMSATMDGDRWTVTCTGLDIDIAAGDYWIGITPIAPGGMWGPELHLSTMDYWGGDTVSYDPYGLPPTWIYFNPGLDGTLIVEGTVVSTSTEEATWGSVKNLFR